MAKNVVTQYKSGDFIFAKVKGYPPWPARIQAQNGKKYFVYFYGTGETANLPRNRIFDYSVNKDRFLKKVVKRKDFNDGVEQIEYDFANNAPLRRVIGALERGASPTGEWECRVRVECERVKEEGESEEGEVCAVKHELCDGRDIKEESCASRDVKEELYPGHEVKEELVLGPTRLQLPDAAFAPGLLTASGGISEHIPSSPLWRACSVRVERLAPQTNGRAEHAPREPYTCDACGAQFARKRRLVRHIQRHGSRSRRGPVSSSGPLWRACAVRVERLAPAPTDSPGAPREQYTCGPCGAQFAHKRSLVEHIQRHGQAAGGGLPIHSGDQPYPCQICNEKFSEKEFLAQHLQGHSEETHKCEICSMHFEQKESLVIHTRVHTGEKPYKCEFCMRQFSRRNYLLQHRLHHTRGKTYKCEICKKQLFSKIILGIHKRTHDKPFKCEICMKQFLRKNSWLQHKLFHTREKSYKCKISTKQFVQKHCVVVLARIHTEEKHMHVKFV